MIAPNNESIIIDYSTLIGIDTINGGFLREKKKFIGQKIKHYEIK